MHRSTANGPGQRFVVWFQGCTLGCPGCVNPQTHSPAAETTSASRLVDEILGVPDIDGVSISGGEPFQQGEALRYIVERLRAESSLSILIFTGYSLKELKLLPSASVLDFVDVLVAGRYVQSLHRAQGLLGSANQRLHRLTARYSASELENLPELEWQLRADGTTIVTGIGAVELVSPNRLQRRIEAPF